MLQYNKIIVISMIQDKWIGATFTIKKGKVRQTVTIENDPKKYSLYRALGLDHIFTEDEPKKMTFPKHKRRKKRDSDISNTSEQGSTDIDGEDNDK